MNKRKQIEDILVRTINTIHQETNLNKPKEFRVSSFPHCAMMDLYDRFAPKEESYKMDFFTGSGTAIHEAIQKWIPNLLKDCGEVKPFGDWLCKDKKCGWKSKKPIAQPSHCPKCKGEVKYEEICYHDTNPDGTKREFGHQDFGLQWVADKSLTGLEFKTTGIDSILGTGQYIPDPKHLVQIRTYMTLARMQYGIKFSDFCLIYFSRESPKIKEKKLTNYKVQNPHLIKIGGEVFLFKMFYHHFSDLDYEMEREWVELAFHNNGLLGNLVNSQDVNESLKWIKELIKNRPCQTVNDYNTRLKHRFFMGDCPLKDKCFNNKPDLAKTLLKLKKGLDKNESGSSAGNMGNVSEQTGKKNLSDVKRTIEKRPKTRNNPKWEID